jgi:pimeloyl-ACP methyl ester carboxylesterase
MSDLFVEAAGGMIEFLQLSYPVDRRLSIDELVDYVEERLPLDRPIITFAISFSGPVAVRLLARNRRLYIAAIFCTTFVRAPHPFLLRMGRLLPLAGMVRLSRQDAILKGTFLNARSPKRLVDMLQAAAEMVPAEIIAHRLEQIAEVDDSLLLDSITIPCCGLRARRDLLIPPGAIRPFFQHLKHFEAHDVAGPHAVLLTNPGQCCEVVDNFLGRIQN